MKDSIKAATPSTLEPHANQRAQAPVRHWNEHRRDLVRILFIHSCPADVQRCLHELTRMRLTISSELALTPEDCAERLGLASFDIVIAEYPGPDWRETQLLDLLTQSKKEVPLLFLAPSFKREIAAELILQGAADCIEMENVGHLPVAIHRALDARVLRGQRDRAERELRLSEARFGALAGNLIYGVCHCSLDGRFLDVNHAMMKILGYEARDELLAQFLVRDIFQDPVKRGQLLGQTGEGIPLEAEWKRKDGAVLKIRLSGRKVLGQQGELGTYEVIAEDVTKQRALEDHLRRLAASDPLTGLANYRHLVDVLDSEIKRSKRTGREFALLFLDLDGLKLINDRCGHLEGNQALCRLADVLSASCRDIDTPARFGGDEFAVVLPETHAEDADRVARRICESLANESNGPTLSVSVGIAVYPQNGDSIEQLLSEADSRLYSMKQQKATNGKSGEPGVRR
jgi:diguanylate cyclase (GGDEF)-like protein/PAS domain S-box-containing protein